MQSAHMTSFAFKWLTVVFAAVLLSSFVSMMAAFFGSEGGDLRELMVLQALLIPVAIAALMWSFGTMFRRYGRKEGLRKFWNSLPGWLLFAVVVANSLVLIAELSFALIEHHVGEPRPWQEHLPAATTLFSSIALAACYVSFRLTDRAAR